MCTDDEVIHNQQQQRGSDRRRRAGERGAKRARAGQSGICLPFVFVCARTWMGCRRRPSRMRRHDTATAKANKARGKSNAVDEEDDDDGIEVLGGRGGGGGGREAEVRPPSST